MQIISSMFHHMFQNPSGILVRLFHGFYGSVFATFIYDHTIDHCYRGGQHSPDKHVFGFLPIESGRQLLFLTLIIDKLCVVDFQFNSITY